MNYVSAFIFGGIWCVIAQILMDKTKLTPARILVSFVVIGAILGAFNLYDYAVEVGKAGATVPLPGFGYALSKAAIKEVDEIGLLGAFTGGIKGTAGGITAAIVFGYLMAILFNPKTKE
ncbi:stage V sporulation protein AE [Clostridium cellulovorans]|nr:stage V sporulation protein AE [Clostridium cellulovorans]